MSVLISTGDIGERLDGLLSDPKISDDDKVKGLNLLLQPAFEESSTRFTAERAVAKINQKWKGKYCIITMEAKEPIIVTSLNPFDRYHSIFGLQVPNDNEQTKGKQ